jgi:hypothetical protein
MAAKILVSLTARSARFALFERGALSRLAGYENGESAWNAFGALLQQYSDIPVYLMLDTVDEEYRTEVLPHVRGSARREMLKRKLGQLLRTAPYRASWLQGREQGGGKRQDDIYLFLALNSGELLRPYLDHIQRLRAPLAGIYLLPQVSQALATQLKCATPGVLLVSCQQGGLRQSYLLNGRLRISRLTPFDPQGDPQGDPQRDSRRESAMAEYYAAEIEKSRLFLYNSRLLPRDVRLTVQLLDFDGKLTALPAQLPQDPNLSCQCILFEQVCATLGIAANALPRDSEALHLYLLGKYAPAVSLAAPQLTGDFTVHQWRLGLYAASAALTAAALLWSGYNLYRGYANQAAIKSVMADTARYRAQYEEAARHFPAAPVSADKLRRAVEITGQIKQLARTPETFMQTVSQGLNAFPQIQLDRMQWQYAPDPGVAATAQAMNAGLNWRQQGEIEAEIRPFTGDYRSALALIERFAAALRSQAGVADVKITKLPVDLDSGTALSGSTQDNVETKPGAAQFKLKIMLKRKP